jgi:phospholipid/cholesterol/gamma-HCH transport system permease protein
MVAKREHVADTPLQVTGNPPHPPQGNDAASISNILIGGAKETLLRVQEYFFLALQSITNVFSGPHYLQDTLDQMDSIGVGSVPIVLLTGFFIGAVMVLQTASQFVRFGQTSLTGDAVALALVRELGPTLTSLLVTGRCASGIASELGSMLVTEQVDAMRAMGTDPSRKLVTPRVVAAVLTVPLLACMSDFIGLVGGSVAAVFSLRLGVVQFWTRAINALEFSDIMQGMMKAIVFGFILSSVGCYQGLTVRGGTQGVGRATTQAVVVSSVMIIVADTFLTKLALYLADKLF